MGPGRSVWTSQVQGGLARHGAGRLPRSRSRQGKAIHLPGPPRRAVRRRRTAERPRECTPVAKNSRWRQHRTHCRPRAGGGRRAAPLGNPGSAGEGPRVEHRPADGARMRIPVGRERRLPLRLSESQRKNWRGVRDSKADGNASPDEPLRASASNGANLPLSQGPADALERTVASVDCTNVPNPVHDALLAAANAWVKSADVAGLRRSLLSLLQELDAL